MLQGIDLSHWESVSDFGAVQKGGTKFIYLKATQGVGNVDVKFHRYWQQCRVPGITVGAYHFMEPFEDANQQTQNFIRTVPRIAGDLPPVFDCEVNEKIHPLTAELREAVLNLLQVWLPTVRTVYGVMPVIYGSPSFLNFLQLPLQFSQCPLWVAEYGVDKPKPTGPWGKYTFWQYSESQQLEGLPDPVDANWFNGDEAALQAICIPKQD